MGATRRMGETHTTRATRGRPGAVEPGPVGEPGAPRSSTGRPVDGGAPAQVQGERAIHKTRAAGEMPDPLHDSFQIFPAEFSERILLTEGGGMWQDVATPRLGVIPAQEEAAVGVAYASWNPFERTQVGQSSTTVCLGCGRSFGDTTAWAAHQCTWGPEAG